jgi:hypothetical protein
MTTRITPMVYRMLIPGTRPMTSRMTPRTIMVSSDFAVMPLPE